MTSKVVKYKLPCPSKTCHSSDAYHIYDDGHGYCYSCGYFQPGAEDINRESIYDLAYEDEGAEEITYDEAGKAIDYGYITYRSLLPETLEFFDAAIKFVDGTPHSIGYPYPNGAVKVRAFPKTFRTQGDFRNATLFAKNKFAAGSNRSITIVEGENDAMALWQALGGKFPVVSVRSGSSAVQDCKAEYDYLNSFERIYLCFDNDKVGNEAKEAVARLFDFNKLYDVKLTKHKDAHGHVENGDAEVLRQVWWNSRKFLPEGIYSSFNDFDKLLDEEVDKASVPFPFPTLDAMTRGIRTGEVYLFTALEGIGKTEFFRAIEYHLLKSTTDNIGILHLEESRTRTVKGIANYELKEPVHIDPDFPKDLIKEAYRKAIGTDDRVHIYSHFGSDDPDTIINAIRFLVTVCGCKYVFLDHISIVVSGLNDDKERQTLDYISTKLATMANDLDFALFMISHINDDGKTRGSRNISKVAHTHIQLDRDKINPDPVERNLTYTTIHKNRYASVTGPSSVLYFDPTTFVVEEYNPLNDPRKKPPVD